MDVMVPVRLTEMCEHYGAPGCSYKIASCSRARGLVCNRGEQHCVAARRERWHAGVSHVSPGVRPGESQATSAPPGSCRRPQTVDPAVLTAPKAETKACVTQRAAEGERGNRKWLDSKLVCIWDGTEE